MNRSMKWFLVLCILCVTFALPIILQNSINAPTKTNGTAVSPTLQVSELPRSAVRFVSIAPTLAKAGESFSYRVSVEATPVQTIVVTAPIKPEWLTWDATNMLLSGNVPKTVGSFTVTLRATGESGDSVDQTFTVIAQSSEQSVKGVKTVASTDPFHPSVTVTSSVIVLPAQPEVAQVSGVPTQQSVLGEKAQGGPTIEVSYLVYGTAILLSLACGYLLARIVRSGKEETHKTASGIVIQSTRS